MTWKGVLEWQLLVYSFWFMVTAHNRRKCWRKTASVDSKGWRKRMMHTWQWLQCHVVSSVRLARSTKREVGGPHVSSVRLARSTKQVSAKRPISLPVLALRRLRALLRALGRPLALVASPGYGRSGK